MVFGGRFYPDAAAFKTAQCRMENRHRLQSRIHARCDWDSLARGPTDGVIRCGARFRLSAYGGDAERGALRLSARTGKANRVIDISADIGIQRNFFIYERFFGP